MMPETPVSDLCIIPKPVRVDRTPDHCELTPETIVVARSEGTAPARLFASWVERATGVSLPIQSAAPDTHPVVEIIPDSSVTILGSEGYRLSVTPKRVSVRSAHANGLLHGLQTLRQLLPVAAYGPQPETDLPWTIPCVEIEDYPRFEWRGAMLDVARHFMPKPFVLKFIDLLAMHKLNTFHWHLTDDQGWRIEIKKYPRLTQVGAWRTETVIGHWREVRESPAYDGQRHGGFYSQEDIREIVAYASDRAVTVVPEIEMPGHAQAAIAAYPELGSTGRQLEVSRRWGVHEDVFNVDESTIGFLQDVLAEVLDLFPGQFVHIGGDEVPKTPWQQSPKAQARIRELGLRDEEELQSYFIRRMDQFLVSRGRRPVGWDEILEGGLAPNTTVMSWRGEAGGIAAANAGHDVVMAPNTHTYLDHYQTEDHSQEPLAIGGLIPLEKIYAYEPVPAGLDAGQEAHILGTQAQLWTEYMTEPGDIEYMAFPRLCALAEVAWTPAANKGYADFVVRLKHHLTRLDRMAVNYRPLDRDS